MYSADLHAATSKSTYLSAKVHFPKIDALKFHKTNISIFKSSQLEEQFKILGEIIKLLTTFSPQTNVFASV